MTFFQQKKKNALRKIISFYQYFSEVKAKLKNIFEEILLGSFFLKFKFQIIQILDFFFLLISANL